MKKNLNTLLAEISAEQLEKLAAIVQETIVETSSHPRQKAFTTSDLWNIQRQGKPRVQRHLSY